MFLGCSVFENCKTCNNGTWKAQDDFYIREQYCTDCRQGWSGGDCMSKFGFSCKEVVSGNISLQNSRQILTCTLVPEAKILCMLCKHCSVTM